MENEEKEEPIGQLLHGESVTPLVARGEWRMENGEWKLPMSQHVVRIYAATTTANQAQRASISERSEPK
jgi:hypothetical protein